MTYTTHSGGDVSEPACCRYEWDQTRWLGGHWCGLRPGHEGEHVCWCLTSNTPPATHPMSGGTHP